MLSRSNLRVIRTRYREIYILVVVSLISFMFVLVFALVVMLCFLGRLSSYSLRTTDGFGSGFRSVPHRLLSSKRMTRCVRANGGGYHHAYSPHVSMTTLKASSIDTSKTDSDTKFGDDKNDIVWPISSVRSKFVDYFVSKRSHSDYKSSPVVPINDPTLLFSNAGMNQFKPIFIGTVDPSSPLASLTRAANSQKCIRAGGKHNDLDDVGKDTYHHTFFEMLGSWSFGDYFKEEAIDWAWDLLVNEYKLPTDRLYVSYFGGDESQGLPVDTEARDMWAKYLPPERILPFDKTDNFWEMGDTGPCGPCSEIHFDRIGGRDAASLVNADDPDVIEIWNLVFIQFNREDNGSLKQLPNKHIDTGMGLERITSILQDKKSNYDTDAFTPIFEAIQTTIGCKPYTGKLGDEDAASNFKDMAYRVIADHIRTLSFAIADGAVPSNEGRGYVLRRVLRRAIRYGMQTLGAKPGFFAELVPTVADVYGNAFPELRTKMSDVIEVIAEEEASFATLLDKGVKYFDDIVADLGSTGSTKVISGERAFYLYDTLGFPVDLTQLMAEEKGLSVDIEEFKAEMKKQKDRSRLATQSKRLHGKAVLTMEAEATSYLKNAGVLPTEDSHKYVWDTPVGTTVDAILSVDGFVQHVDSSMESFGIVLESSPFYAEAGGQVADTGTLTVNTASGPLVVHVVDVQTYGGFVLHTCVAAEGLDLCSISVGSSVTANVDYNRRRKVAPNHTMTHILNFALRDVVGEEVDQKGSLVSDEKFRFDFNCKKALSSDQIVQVENIMNDVVRSEMDVFNDVVPLDDALAIYGLRAVFGETYPDPVRVISVGPNIENVIADPKNENWKQSSIEFCGGTHLSNTREAVACCILEETAVAKGIRRISGITGEEAKEAINKAVEMEIDFQSLKDAVMTKKEDAGALERKVVDYRTNLDSAVISVGKKAVLRNEVEGLAKKVVTLKNEAMVAKVNEGIKGTLDEVKAISVAGDDTAVLSVNIGSDSKAIKRAIEEIKKVDNNMSFIGVTGDDSRISIFAVVTDAAQAKGMKADEWVTEAISKFGGRGGGRPNMAQGSISDPSKITEILVEAKMYQSKF